MAIISQTGLSGINSITSSAGKVDFYNSAGGSSVSVTVGQLQLTQQSSTQRNTGVGTAIGTLIYNSTTQQLEVYSGPAGWSGGLGIPFSATGGNLADGLAPGNGYKYHTFGSSGSFVATGSPKPVDILLVAPGGGGGGSNAPTGTDGGAGGGAGGLVLVAGYPFSAGTYTITIAGGGSGGPANASPGTVGGDVTITNPVIGTLTAKGGGRGGAGPLTPNPGGPGGSGGGEGGGGGTSGGVAAKGTGIQPTQPQGIFASYYLQYGNDGGYCAGGGTPPYHGSGGGGSGGAGGNGNSGGPGIGGDGRQFSQFSGPTIGVPALNPLSGFFAAGGGGGCQGPLNNPKAGGNGGGGPGGAVNSPGTAGTQYTGSGGGGGGGTTASSGGSGANGGAGLIVIRYPVI